MGPQPAAAPSLLKLAWTQLRKIAEPEWTAAKAPRAGFETSSKTLGNDDVLQIVGAEGGANIVADDDLQTLIEAWPALDDDVRASILKMIG